MRKSLILLLLTVCLSIFAPGCNSAAAPEQTLPAPETQTATLPPVTTLPVTEAAAETTQATAAQTSPDTTEVTENPEPTATEAPETEATEATVTAAQLHQPVMDPPEVGEEPCHFFDDAAFIGDSISYSLMVYNTKTGELGKPLFLVRGSLSLHNTQNNQMAVHYQGKAMTPWEALAASGVKKVFIHLGTNDIGYYGVEETMAQWETFLGHIRETCPEIEVYIQSLLPMWTPAQQELLNNDNIDLFNTRMEAFAEENGCHYVNIAPYFKDHTNGLAEPYCGDLYVHMKEGGNVLWARVLRAYAAEQEKEKP